eukprot:gnl/TRDRNA2_/TRDRNA2_154299_c0_seq1.p1 gnl/TRDRNA2_/TRDRNA2_154299_c0~~gnl/TRDRNA2_/TRDRNA2_154299_c0_seq1.p1  ORF type:complete len:222 (-),score=26.20 gnl/TRDRNA2_/TRDRNA2_154299_c0_seq1:440-1105(-)
MNPCRQICSRCFAKASFNLSAAEFISRRVFRIRAKLGPLRLGQGCQRSFLVLLALFVSECATMSWAEACNASWAALFIHDHAAKLAGLVSVGLIIDILFFTFCFIGCASVIVIVRKRRAESQGDFAHYRLEEEEEAEEDAESSAVASTGYSATSTPARSVTATPLASSMIDEESMYEMQSMDNGASWSSTPALSVSATPIPSSTIGDENMYGMLPVGYRGS